MPETPPSKKWDADLPDWLRGHIHPPPGAAEAAPQAPASIPAPPGPAAPAEQAHFTGLLPWLDEQAAPGGAAQPGAPGSLRGLTGQLPWLDDVLKNQPAAGDEAAPVDFAAEWLEPGERTAPAPGPSEPPAPGGSPFGQDAPAPGSLRGLTGQLPWLDDVVQPSGEPSPAGMAADDLAALDWMGEDETPPTAPAAPAQPWEVSAGDWPSADEPPAAPLAARELPAAPWLSQAPIPAMPAADAPPPPSSDAVPDWLAAAESFGHQEPPPAAPGGAVPDWLAAAEAFGQGSSVPQPADSTPNWLGSADDFAAGFEDETPAPSAVPAGSVPDWLGSADDFAAGFEDEAFAAPAPEPEEAAPAWVVRADTGDLPELPESDLTYEEWTAQQEEAQHQPTQEELLAAEVPDWFGQVEGEAEAVPAPVPSAAPSGPDFVPDWYLGLEEQDTSAAPDWFAGMDLSADALSAAPVLPEVPDVDESFDFGPDEAEAAPVASAGDVPDWFSGIGAEAAPAAPVSETPDWFSDMGAPAAPTVPPAPVSEPDFDFDFDLGQAEAPAAPVSETPDWFAAFDEQPAAPSPAAPIPDEVPDWLNVLPVAPRPAQPMPPEMLSTEGIIAEGADLDFMSLIGDQLGPQAPATPEAAGPADLLTEKYANFDLDDLLGDLQMSDSVPLEGLASVELPPEVAAAAARTPQGADEEVPDWLARARPMEGGRQVSAVAEALRTPETPLDQLTDRLKALRVLTGEAARVEPPADEGAAAQIQGAVLAGITGGLAPTAAFREPGAPEMVRTLRVERAQEAKIAALQSLLGLGEVAAEPEVQVDEEGQPLPPDPKAEARETARMAREERRTRARTRRRPDRMIISLLLLVATLLPFFVGMQFIGLPADALDPQHQGTLDRSIQGLGQGDLVLVGFEFSPTAAGELDPLAETLLTHILLRGARPVIVSTNPAGILHARDVLARLATDPFVLAHRGRAPDDPLTMPADYVILPYLPGGVVGLRSLVATSTDASALDRGVFAVDFQGGPTGLTVRLMQLSFELVLVLAERGDDLRLWVEQVAAAVDLPVAAGVTAAAEPVARPYFDSGQLVALLAGYRDAFTYDQVLLRSLPAVTSLPPRGEAAALEPTATLDPNVTVSPAPEGLATLTPTPTITPSPTATPTDTPTASPVPSETPTPTPVSNRDATATARAIASGTLPPTPIPTQRSFLTATPVPEGYTGAAVGPTAQPDVVTAERPYHEERWYSMGLGAVVATLIIGLGAVVNIVRGIRRRREP